MRKVGATTSGSVIVEMSPLQFEALRQAMEADPVRNQRPIEGPRPELKTMALRKKLEHVRNCVLKLKPSTKEELIRSIKTVGPFTGGFADTEIEHLLAILTKEKLFTVSIDGHLAYPSSTRVGREAVKVTSPPMQEAYSSNGSTVSARDSS